MILVERLVQLATFDLRKQFYRQSLSWDLAIFGQQHDSELLSRFTNDVGGLQTGLSTLFGKALVEPLKMIACLIVASFISWQLLVFSLLVAEGVKGPEDCPGLNDSHKTKLQKYLEQFCFEP